MPARTRIALLGLSVGIVLADSSVVTIALPEILAQYDVEIQTLAWALTSFNLALALAALPAAFVARRRPTNIETAQEGARHGREVTNRGNRVRHRRTVGRMAAVAQSCRNPVRGGELPWRPHQYG